MIEQKVFIDDLDSFVTNKPDWIDRNDIIVTFDQGILIKLHGDKPLWKSIEVGMQVENRDDGLYVTKPKYADYDGYFEVPISVNGNDLLKLLPDDSSFEIEEIMTTIAGNKVFHINGEGVYQYDVKQFKQKVKVMQEDIR